MYSTHVVVRSQVAAKRFRIEVSKREAETSSNPSEATADCPLTLIRTKWSDKNLEIWRQSIIQSKFQQSRDFEVQKTGLISFPVLNCCQSLSETFSDSTEWWRCAKPEFAGRKMPLPSFRNYPGSTRNKRDPLVSKWNEGQLSAFLDQKLFIFQIFSSSVISTVIQFVDFSKTQCNNESSLIWPHNLWF